MAATLKGIRSGLNRVWLFGMDFERAAEINKRATTRRYGKAYAAQLRRTADKVDSYVRKYYGAD